MSDLLGDKPFIFGDKPSLADIVVFCYITVFLYLPEDSPSYFKRILRTDFPELIALHQRVRDLYWKDWPVYED